MPDIVNYLLDKLGMVALGLIGIIWRSTDKRIERLENQCVKEKECKDRHEQTDKKFDLLFTKLDKIGEDVAFMRGQRNGERNE